MTSDATFSPSRRAFLALARTPETHDEPAAAQHRPPWTTDASLREACCSSGACIAACPEGILQIDETGLPEVVFSGKECTFCGKCAEACNNNVYDLTITPPWTWKAEIADGCLQELGVSCQMCRDICPVSAIRVDLDKRPFGCLKIEAESCTGCGACLDSCPEKVIQLVEFQPGTSRDQEVA